MRAKTYDAGWQKFGLHCPCCEATFVEFDEPGEMTCRYCGVHFEYRQPTKTLKTLMLLLFLVWQLMVMSGAGWLLYKIILVS